MYKLIEDKIYIPYADHNRTLRIYLPNTYDENKSFPVIYMHDAQNLFEVETSSYGHIWDIHTHLNRQYELTGFECIVVGIDNWEGMNNRLNEYSPWINHDIKNDSLLEDITTDVGGLGKEYVDFLVNKLKPYIDKNYKTIPDREHTAIIGSSMGGLISLYAGLKYPNIYSKIGAFSTAVWFAEKDLLELIHVANYDLPSKWYLDIGTNETSNNKKKTFNKLYITGTEKTYKAILKHIPSKDALLVVDDGGIHNETYWSKRFPGALKFLFQSYETKNL